MVEQQKIDVAEESTITASNAKINKKEKTDEDNLLETKKGKGQDDATGQELEDL